MELLAERGADLAAENANGSNVLHYAANLEDAEAALRSRGGLRANELAADGS